MFRPIHTQPADLVVADVPVIDVRRDGPLAHAQASRPNMVALQEKCLSVVPSPMRRLAPSLDRLSSRWLARTRTPYLGEIANIAALAGRPGVWFVNASYEWGCTTRIDAAPTPRLRRTLDWPFPGLGRHVEIALQDGGAGVYANVTWPGAVGVLTGVAPGRFAAAINQAPMHRRTRGIALFPADFVLNAVAMYRTDGCWPVAHLLRHAFDTCADFDAAVALLSGAPVAKPVLFSLVGPEPGQSCLIERTETEAVVRRGGSTIANEWHPEGPRRAGRWEARGTYIRGADDSERRRRSLEAHATEQPFDWLRAPVLNGFTRLAVEASAATCALRVIGYEPTTRWMKRVAPATAMVDIIIDRDGIRVPPAATAQAVE